MAKWFGQIGFAVTEETAPDVWTEHIIERSYYGDIIRNTKSLGSSNQINDGFNISNQISFIADPYARENFYRMKYATFQGARWKITNVSVEYPRLTMTFGGLWNGEEPEESVTYF